MEQPAPNADLRRQAADLYAEHHDPENGTVAAQRTRRAHARLLTHHQQIADPDRLAGYTPEEIERGHAQLAAANPHDPVADILGHPSDQRPGHAEPECRDADTILAERGFVHQASRIDRSHIVAIKLNMDQFAERLMATMRAIDTIDLQAVAANAATRTPVDTPVNRGQRRSNHAVPRARHGAATTCPQHGPTTGGTCRRCPTR